MRIGILECDHVGQRYCGIAGDYTDMFAAMLSPVVDGLEIVAYDACAGELPHSPDECGGWLATGSRWSVYDDLPWIEPLCAFVRTLHAGGAPFVGVCFGHQLLAHALGGTVERSSSGWGAGNLRTTLRAERPWMTPPADDVSLLFMHQDTVTALPPEGTVLGAADHCPVAMFEVGPSMLGVQAHPEFGAAYVEALLTDREERIGASETSSALASLQRPTDEALVARWTARFFECGR